MTEAMRLLLYAMTGNGSDGTRTGVRVSARPRKPTRLQGRDANSLPEKKYDPGMPHESKRQCRRSAEPGQRPHPNNHYNTDTSEAELRKGSSPAQGPSQKRE